MSSINSFLWQRTIEMTTAASVASRALADLMVIPTCASDYSTIPVPANRLEVCDLTLCNSGYLEWSNPSFSLGWPETPPIVVAEADWSDPCAASAGVVLPPGVNFGLITPEIRIA